MMNPKMNPKVPGKKRLGGVGRGMVTLHIQSKDELYQSYLPFLKNGGIFVPTEKSYQLGDEVFVMLTLLDDKKEAVSGKVAWVNPRATQGNRPAGIGVHFGEIDQGKMKQKIEAYLAGALDSEKSTFTM